MKAKNVLIFGCSGQIGRSIVRKLTKDNFSVIAVTRNIHQKGIVLKTLGNAGFIDIVEANIFDEKKIRELFEKTDICINLIGILYEQKKGNTFKNIHSVFPTILAKLCKEYNLKHFIHLSALGINEAVDSDYAKSKLEGENEIIKNFPFQLVQLSQYFSLAGCKFGNEKYKKNCARLGIFRDYDLTQSFTIESSCWGYTQPKTDATI